MTFKTFNQHFVLFYQKSDNFGTNQMKFYGIFNEKIESNGRLPKVCQ